MYQLKIFIELTRLNKPIGFMLLFWPCAWGLAYAYNLNSNLEVFIKYLILFFLGSVLMRSAGCIINDVVDKNFDKKVKRTRQRPIPSGKISVKKSLIYAAVLCMIAFLVLIQFNTLTIILGLGSMFLAFSYPYMKRVTYWPQLFLGLTFNWGIIMSWAAVTNTISIEIIALYLSAIFWTLGYDTIYGAQDMSDDEIIGLKSTSIKFKRNIKIFVGLCYFLSFTTLFLLLTKKFEFKFDLFIFFMSMYLFTLIYQLKIFDKNKPKSCLKAFKTNNFTGIFIFFAILSN